jgi:hypothetical protein
MPSSASMTPTEIRSGAGSSAAKARTLSGVSLLRGVCYTWRAELTGFCPMQRAPEVTTRSSQNTWTIRHLLSASHPKVVNFR